MTSDHTHDQPQSADQSGLLDCDRQAKELVEWIRTNYYRVVVAFSGGVDSAVVAAAAFRALGANAVAWTGRGAAVPESDLLSAASVANSIGIEHVVVATQEIENTEYVANRSDRCFHCKSTLYETISNWAQEHGFETILSGTNADDLGDYRPGLRAAANWKVAAPLAELGYRKNVVRSIASHLGLSVADKPASPCLASRIAYGQLVTIGKLGRIEEMETWLSSEGFYDVRARMHADDLLRLEIHANELAKAVAEPMRSKISTKATELGFRYVTIDIQGRQSGSMNRALNDI